MPDSPLLTSSQEAIDNGRKYYTAKRYKPALEQFTRAMKGCSCARGLKRERCVCKNFEKVANDNESIFKEAMYNCHCSVGKTFNKCDNEMHIQALDYRAATFEALQELGRARKDAEWILELAPRREEGYLRLGKIARLEKKYEFAWKIYSAGIQASAGVRNSSSSKHKQLYKARDPLHRRFCRRDPIHLPLEIIQFIFGSFDIGMLSKCLRVSKLWRDALTARGNERLWKNLDFTQRNIKRPPRLDSLRKLAKRSGNDVRRIFIENGRQFYLSQAKLLALLNGAKNLESIDISKPYEPIMIPKAAGRYQQLKHIRLEGFLGWAYRGDHNQAFLPDAPGYFIEHVLDVLEHLDLVHVPTQWLSTTALPSLPKLKSLKLGSSAPDIGNFMILQFAKQTPALEQLYTSDLQLSTIGSWDSEWQQLWTHLKVLVVQGRGVLNPESSSTVSAIASVNQGTRLQILDVAAQWKRDRSSTASNFLFGDPAVIPSLMAVGLQQDYRDLRCLRLGQTALNPQSAQLLLEDTMMRNKKLHTFDIVFPLPSYGSQVGEVNCEYLVAYSWMRGAESIRSMGVFGFRFKEYPRDDNELPLPSFLATFPNLETLEIHSDHYEEAEFCTVVAAILKATKLKTIYQDRVNGVMMDQLKALADSHGVAMIRGERPRTWPRAIEL